ncbi:MAG: hypothetical protein A2V45_12380 [Candidatus Aminicenantes bacterium RBG_19FT_COMBO_58_17]|nr:MAG: hypothetical protein A2V45_12380 [Candidatus Aminicenantes bacterium RBG_19FT_COMBO_58_17]HCS49683.1 hypothetical protein [Candidatus Aminicenantes bacterium]
MNFKTQGGAGPYSLPLLLAAISISAFFPLLFVVLPAVFAHLFLVLFRPRPIEDLRLPFCLLAPPSLRSPPF